MPSVDYHLAVLWNWEGDKDFVSMVAMFCKKFNLNFLEITPENINNVLRMLLEKTISFQALLDRASESDSTFLPIIKWAQENNVLFINSFELSKRAFDKSIIHYELINNGLTTPDTIILPSYNESSEIPEKDISHLGNKFIVKPACGGGGEGVSESDSWEKVLSIRREFPEEKYLLQANIIPKEIESRSAWFRIIYSFENIYPFWWDRSTHLYREVTNEEEEKYLLTPLRTITKTIANICQLNLFSTEIALTNNDLFVVVDYVNDQIDLRLKSKNHESVPDETVYKIAEQIVTSLLVKNN